MARTTVSYLTARNEMDTGDMFYNAQFFLVHLLSGEAIPPSSLSPSFPPFFSSCAIAGSTTQSLQHQRGTLIN